VVGVFAFGSTFLDDCTTITTSDGGTATTC